MRERRGAEVPVQPRPLHPELTECQRFANGLFTSAELTLLADEIPVHDIRGRWSAVERLARQVD